MNVVFASRKGKRNDFKRKPGPKPVDCLLEEARKFPPLKSFRFGRRQRSSYAPKFSRIAEFSGSLERGSCEAVLFRKLISRISCGGQALGKLSAVAGIVGSRDFEPQMLPCLHALCKMDKPLMRLKLFGSMMADSKFRGMAFRIGADMLADRGLESTEKAFDAVRSILGSGFAGALLPAIASIAKNSEGQETYWSLYVLNKIANNRNFCEELAPHLLLLSSGRKPGLQWTLELVNGFISNRRFGRHMLTAALFSDLSGVSGLIAGRVSRERVPETFLGFRDFLSRSGDAFVRVPEIRREAEGMPSGEKLTFFLTHLKKV